LKKGWNMLCHSCEHRKECEATGLPLQQISRVIIMLSVGATKENIKTIYEEFEGKNMDEICDKISVVADQCPLGQKEIPAVAC
jgi:hypothetical protein